MAEASIAKAAGTPGIVSKDGAAAPATATTRKARPTQSKAILTKRVVFVLIALVVMGGLVYVAWQTFRPAKLPAGFASSNGRIEATEIDVATKLAGRIVDELVDEGIFVNAGQVVAHMDTDVLQAQHREADGQTRHGEKRRGHCEEHADPAPERKGGRGSCGGAARSRLRPRNQEICAGETSDQ